MENTNQSNQLPSVLMNGILLIPSIGIPYLFGSTAIKVGGFVLDTAGSALTQVKDVVFGQTIPAAQPENKAE
ncbi:hypothetical protein Ctha_2307 [Chloroherpeton thalassium ATCC 35110]|uniref:Uncharacterized protein n=1 Tax=Chloroherpeton thalassium (strain ATCC 35110 / GB-78) TaxID=517418 RepID=B3QWJ8_CHLT3|nr:hypothetical protein [Chloroherpeton thalassium]ACF14758.1 hypothetical protein Ctha_2307 [Chloroherpeton thalassium ATCC 35110]